VQHARIGRLFAASGVALLAKCYAVLLLYVAFTRAEFHSEYAAYLWRPEDMGREERLEEVEASFLHRLTPLDGRIPRRPLSPAGHPRVAARDRALALTR